VLESQLLGTEAIWKEEGLSERVSFLISPHRERARSFVCERERDKEFSISPVLLNSRERKRVRGRDGERDRESVKETERERDKEISDFSCSSRLEKAQA